MATTQFHPVVQELIDMIAQNGWQSKFEEALKKAQSYNVIGFEDVKTLDDYFKWIDDQLKWVPVENLYGKVVFQHVCKFYFILDQSPVKELQNPVTPHDKMQPLTPLSAWMRKFMNALGEWMDDPASITEESESTFFKCPPYNMKEYVRPRGGWKTVNQLFARRTKPGYRPIAAIDDPHIIVSPAESTFAGQWEVNSNTAVNIKGLYWQIQELLEGSQYKDCFEGGQWTHSFLNTYDYHRQHAPVMGTILEARVIQGAVYVQMTLVPAEGQKDAQTILGKTVAVNPDASNKAFKIDAPDLAGYEFMQTRGIFIIDSPIGLVAVCPIGMGQVSSIVPTAEVGRTLYKGEEISYFQFGGSDCCMAFQEKSNISFTAQPGVHYKVGTKIADAYPVIDYKVRHK